MAFFDLLNAGAGPSAKYAKMSALPLYVPMKIENIEQAETVIGVTTKIKLGTSRIFFLIE